jgi:hypothetical protein
VVSQVHVSVCPFTAQAVLPGVGRALAVPLLRGLSGRSAGVWALGGCTEERAAMGIRNMARPLMLCPGGAFGKLAVVAAP